MSDGLSQAEIDALMNGGSAAAEDDSKEEKVEEKTEEQSEAEIEKEAVEDAALDVDDEIIAGMDEQARMDLIGEVGNISMSQAATTLSSILNHRVSITTPRVTKIRFASLMEGIKTPKVATTVEYKEGVIGTNLMLLQVRDASIIADLMMGGPGNAKDDAEFGDLELSAVAEAMNQMIGSASTSMATMINRKVDILPPTVKLWGEPDNISYDGINPDSIVYRISFNLDVEGLIESEIMQIFTKKMVNDIAAAMMADKATVVNDREVPAEEQKAPVAPQLETAPAAAPTPQAQPQPAPQPAPQPKQPPVEVSQPSFQTLDGHAQGEGDNLDLLMDIPLNLSVVLGTSKKSVREILSFNTGSVIELEKLTDEPLDILLNGKLIAQGEVVVINDNFGVRITNILSQSQRINNMR
ncbi:flagellar motor switch phosphatase FliY [Ligilactobacillus ruminis]|uniref:Flagellar motor switch protein n=2 Tax=Ligilactobacillus ruminis TaxID=1623 RepID=A0A837ISX1_9LACO|nr:flagellar motor switch phosphatase FliY [Ligilactobacillus ruminis]KLA46269.1 flagellar motor switch protein [Ligilactobacillus ruminis]KRM83265.1 flagellar motor switch protein [Ligilactobacillus ruminis DSM 20403 = NBRC 102161]SFG30846.1 flagellar motor switch protein FliN/FliY [Ligilactobacillus ruminis DSM 20403 = NBRC 102161]